VSTVPQVGPAPSSRAPSVAPSATGSLALRGPPVPFSRLFPLCFFSFDLDKAKEREDAAGMR